MPHPSFLPLHPDPDRWRHHSSAGNQRRAPFSQSFHVQHWTWFGPQQQINRCTLSRACSVRAGGAARRSLGPRIMKTLKQPVVCEPIESLRSWGAAAVLHFHLPLQPPCSAPWETSNNRLEICLCVRGENIFHLSSKVCKHSEHCPVPGEETHQRRGETRPPESGSIWHPVRAIQDKKTKLQTFQSWPPFWRY